MPLKPLLTVHFWLQIQINLNCVHAFQQDHFLLIPLDPK